MPADKLLAGVTEEMVERAARAYTGAPFPSETTRRKMRKALAAALAETHVVVPRDPTETMLDEISDHCVVDDDVRLVEAWRAMLSAATRPSEEK